MSMHLIEARRAVKHAATALCALLLLTSASIAAPSQAARQNTQLPKFIAGVDISLLTAEENAGRTFTDTDERRRPLLAILKAHGYNCVRLRLWVHPSGSGLFVNDLPYTIALGRRAKQAGFLLLLDLHYSDGWADPGHQTKPAAWQALPFNQLVDKVRDYSKAVITQMRSHGAMPDIVQIGNEIPGGLLWPDGKDFGAGHDFHHLALLLKAGIEGVNEGSPPESSPRIMIHIDRGGDWQTTKWFFDNIRDQGVPYDIIGESYYPIYHGPMSGLKLTLQNAAKRYHKPIMVVETGYPYMSWASDSTEASAEAKSWLEYPLTPAGQRDYLLALVGTLEQTPEGLGAGVVYWEPEWLPAPGLDGPGDGKTLFSDDGKALPGLDALGEAGRSK